MDSATTLYSLQTVQGLTLLCLLFGAGYVAYHFLGSREQVYGDLPVVEVEHGKLREIVYNATKKYPDTPFVLMKDRPIVILPIHVMDEVRFLSEDQVSLRKEVYVKMHGKYTNLGTDHSVTINAIKTDLTSHIGRMLPEIQEESIYALQREIGRCPQWTKISLWSKLLQLSAQTNGRMFVGLPLCRDPAWIDLSLKYTVSMVDGIRSVEAIHPWLRPFLASRDPNIRMLAVNQNKAETFLRPYADKVLESLKNRASGKDVPENQYNLITWMLNQMDLKKVDYSLLAGEQLFTSFGSIHITCVTVTNALYDLAAHPEYIPELRAEIIEVLSQEPDQIMRKSSLPKLRKLDSFLRETHRMNPAAFARKITSKKGLRLSTGHVIPYGSTIGFFHPISPYVHPPPTIRTPVDYCPNQPPLSEFYPFRSYEVRSLPGQEGAHQFAMTSPDNINFGHGRHACPGRFFAAGMVKIILMEILRRYDVALGPNGEGRTKTTSRESPEGTPVYRRPENIIQTGSLQVMPDFTKSIYIRELSKVIPVV